MEIQLAKGVRDIPPEEKIVSNRIINTLKEVFELYGFTPLETPILERYETLTAKFAAGEASDALKETFRLKDQGDRDLGLRFDLTVPLSRFIAINPNLKMPFKRYEFGPVFRDGPIKLGRYRQFWQCDIDTIGSKSMLADAEILAVVQEVFNRLGLEIVIKVNNRKLLNGILNQCGIKNKEEAIISIDKLDKIGIKGVTDELISRGYSEKQANQVFSLIKENISLKELQKKVKDSEGLEGLKELGDLFSYLKQMKVKSVQFEVSLARGLAYYTGTVFEAFIVKGAVSSSLAGGGRYDKLIGSFMGGGREVPAVGVSFGLAPIMDTIKAKEDFREKTPARAFVIPIQTINESLKIVQKLRSKKIAVDLDLIGRGVGKNLEYISTLGIPYAIIIGGDELKQKKVLLRDMKSGEQSLLDLKSVVKKLKKK